MDILFTCKNQTVIVRISADTRRASLLKVMKNGHFPRNSGQNLVKLHLIVFLEKASGKNCLRMPWEDERCANSRFVRRTISDV